RGTRARPAIVPPGASAASAGIATSIVRASSTVAAYPRATMAGSMHRSRRPVPGPVPAAVPVAAPVPGPVAAAVAVAVAALAAGGCHTIRSSEDVTRGEAHHERRPDPPRALPPRVELTDDGRLRLLEPLVCAAEVVTDVEVARVDRREPNAATLVVGVIATAVGAVALVSGASADDPGGSPLTYLGPVGVAGGLPLVIGPLVGNGSSRHHVDDRQVRAPAEDEPCGSRPVAATRATVGWSGLRAVGDVDGDGVVSVSPFAFVDAFAVAEAPALELSVTVERADGPPLALDAVIDRPALARAQPGFLARAGVDATVEPIRKVPRFEPGALTVRRAGPSGKRTVELALPLRDAGPGDGFAVRLLLSSPNPELDARVVYVGRIAAHGDVTVTASLPISDEADRALSAGELVLSARLRDAYDAAPDTPIRFQGRVPAP
ncbi:MAG TPA: hypothetical protein VHE35_33980, partial [Kofleriaceae bacterium]|nr:hypothetical protein [Kofleriaceae bacterium]